MWLTRQSLNNPVMVIMIMVAIVVLGLFSYQHLPIEQFPNVDVPIVVINTPYPGASPEVVEADVTQPLERAISEVAGLKSISSVSSYGLSRITAEYNLDMDAITAAQDVREKVDVQHGQLSALGVNVGESQITRFDPSAFPIVSLVLSSTTHNIRELSQLATWVVQRQLAMVPGVGAITVIGGPLRQLNVFLRPQDLTAYRLSPGSVMNAIMANNRQYPIGQLSAAQSEVSVQMTSHYTTARHFSDMIIASSHGQLIRLNQVADVVDGQAELVDYAMVNDQRVVALDVIPQQGANIVAVVDHIRRSVAALRPLLPADVQLTVIRDQSKAIRVSLHNLQSIVLEGVFFTVLIVFIFLASWRSTVITGLTLPISLLGSFSILYLAGYTVNFLTLMALSLCVGLLVDDAIVVRENIMRHVLMNKGNRQAALDGTAEIGLAVLATTATIVAVFLPVGFIQGIIGRYFHQFGITVAFVVMLSMFISFTLDPMLSSIWPEPPQGATRLSWLQTFFAGVHRCEQHALAGYDKGLHWALAHRSTVVIGAIAIFVGSVALIPLLGIDFVPIADYDEMYVSFQLPPSATIALSAEKARQVSQVLRAHFAEIHTLYTTIKNDMTHSRNAVSLYIQLIPLAQRTKRISALIEPMRRAILQVAGVTVTFLGAAGSHKGGQKSITLHILGVDMTVLEHIVKRVVTAMRAVPGVSDIETTTDDENPSIELEVDTARAMDLGVTPAMISQFLGSLLTSQKISSWIGPDGERYDVTMGLAPENRTQNIADQFTMVLLTATTPVVTTLQPFLSWRSAVSPAKIYRRSLLRAVTISANNTGRPLGDVARDIAAAVAREPLPSGYSVQFSGASQDMKESFQYAVSLFGLVLFFIYVILASQFRSFLDPITIMLALPLSLVGVVLALLVCHATINLFSVIGFVTLMGLVTKNGILLVDFINQDMRRGVSRRVAILRAGEIRLRPIVMTSVAMVVGMLPQAISRGTGSETRAPMAQAVIGGIVASTILTLLVVPVVYSLFDDVRLSLRKRLFHNDPK